MLAQIAAAGPCSLPLRRYLDEENISPDPLPVEMIPADRETVRAIDESLEPEFSCRTQTEVINRTVMSYQGRTCIREIEIMMAIQWKVTKLTRSHMEPQWRSVRHDEDIILAGLEAGEY